MLALGLLVGLTVLEARSTVAPGEDQTEDLIWQFEAPPFLTPADQVTQRTVRLDIVALRRVLARAPLEFETNDNRAVMLPLPMPDGSLLRFKIEESPIISESMAASYPELKTYSGRADGATTRCIMSSLGFHATVLPNTSSAIVSIRPAGPEVGESTHSTSARYVTTTGTGRESGEWECGVREDDPPRSLQGTQIPGNTSQTGRACVLPK